MLAGPVNPTEKYKKSPLYCASNKNQTANSLGTRKRQNKLQSVELSKSAAGKINEGANKNKLGEG